MLGSLIDASAWSVALQRIADWTARRESRYVCICNVHSVVTASRDPAFSLVLNQADMATRDGAPVAWMLRKLRFVGQARINGPDLMWRYCGQAAETGQLIFLYGGSAETLELLQLRLLEQFPGAVCRGVFARRFAR